MMKRAILILFFPLLVMAAPGPGTSYVLNEPASLMDIGILRAKYHMAVIEESMNAIVRNGTKNDKLIVSSYARYEFDDDLIVIGFAVRFSGDNPKLECSEIISANRTMVVNHIEEWFFHDGYQSGDQPKDLKKGIGERIEIRCLAGSTRARTKLMDKEIYWSEE